MPPYAGTEKLDPTKRQAQHALTEALWMELVRQGVRKGATGNIESFLFAQDELAAASLVAAFGTGNWRHEVAAVADEPAKLRVKLVSPHIVLGPEAFHELVDVMMVAALEHRCVFDGFQVDVAAVRRRPWWRVW